MILSRCLSGDFPDCRELAESCEVSRRTILRDIMFLRDRLLAPLESDRSRRGYRLTEGDFNLMPRLDLQDEDVFTLHFIRQALAPYKGTKSGDVIIKSFNRMVNLLIGAQAWKKVDEAGGLSWAASSFRADASTSASQ